LNPFGSLWHWLSAHNAFARSTDAPISFIRYVMGLKKRNLSLVGRGQPSHHRYKRWQLAACGTERLTKKGLGFFGHITWQASGSFEGEAGERVARSRS
jgi:hypothetical protein